MLQPPPAINPTGAMRSSFTFPSAYEGRPLDTGHLEERLVKEYDAMQNVVDGRAGPIGGRRGDGTGRRGTVKKPTSYWKGRRTDMGSVLGCGFRYKPNPLDSQGYGDFTPKEFTNRVPLSIQKKFGGPIGAEICLRRAQTGGTKPKPQAKNKFLATKDELRGLINELHMEADEVNRKIKSLEGTSGSLKERLDEKAQERLRKRKESMPLAMRQGQGDLSTIKLALKTKLVTSQEVRDIMANVDYIEPLNPNPVRNKNTLRSVEADFDTWMNDLGRY